MNHDCAREIFKYLGIDDMLNFCNISSYHRQFIKIINSVIIDRIKKRVSYKLNIEYNSVDTFIKTFDCIISGSLILQCILNEYWSSDIDIYTNVDKNGYMLTNYMDNIKDYNDFLPAYCQELGKLWDDDIKCEVKMCSHYNKHDEQTYVCLHNLHKMKYNNLDLYLKVVNYQSCSKSQHIGFFKTEKFNIDSEVTIKNKFAVARSDDIDIILGDKLKSIESFDFTFLMNYYDGKKLIIKHIDDIINRHSIAHYNIKCERETIFNRIIKYNKRGFVIALPQEVTLTDYNDFMMSVELINKPSKEMPFLYDICRHLIALRIVLELCGLNIGSRIISNMSFRLNKDKILKYIRINFRKIRRKFDDKFKVECYDCHKFLNCIRHNDKYKMINNLEYFMDMKDDDVYEKYRYKLTDDSENSDDIQEVANLW